MADSKPPPAITLRTRKFMTNRLLSRKQFVRALLTSSELSILLICHIPLNSDH